VAKFGLFDTTRSFEPREEVEADYITHDGEYVRLWTIGKGHGEVDALVAVLSLHGATSVRKIE
jgi:hypothetical protein